MLWLVRGGCDCELIVLQRHSDYLTFSAAVNVSLLRGLVGVASLWSCDWGSEVVRELLLFGYGITGAWTAYFR